MRPRHQTQLDGTATQATDCGVRSTSMAIDWSTRGRVVPGVRVVRRRMGFRPTVNRTTNPVDWARAITSYDTPAELGGVYESLSCRAIIAGDWATVAAHLDAGKLVIVAVHYGIYRRLMPARSGSRTFSGYHAIPFLGSGLRPVSYDPLLDGRYRGCPKGPVPVPIGKLREAAEAVGTQEVGRAAVYALLAERAVRVGSGVDIPEPDEPVTLGGILADLRELGQVLSGEPRQEAAAIIADLELLLGPYHGKAAPDADPADGVVTP